jgi:hypothetical protein
VNLSLSVTETVDRDGEGGWRMRRGRVDDGCLTEAQAHERMLALVREHDADQTLIEQDSSARERRGITPRACRAVTAGSR